MKNLKKHYSLKFYENYQRIYKTAPYRNPLKEHFITHNYILFRKDNKYPLFLTEKIIEFPEIRFLQSFRDCCKKYGQPYQYSIHGLFNHTLSIATFKNLMATDDMRIVLYFFDDELRELELMVFKVNESEVNDMLKHYIIDKYVANQDVKTDTFYIEDIEGNQISAHWNGFDIFIKFLCAGSNIYGEAFMEFYNNVWKQKKQDRDQVINEIKKSFLI